MCVDGFEYMNVASQALGRQEEVVGKNRTFFAFERYVPRPLACRIYRELVLTCSIEMFYGQL